MSAHVEIPRPFEVAPGRFEVELHFPDGSKRRAQQHHGVAWVLARVHGVDARTPWRGKQLLFMGSEFGQESEWAESRSLDWWLTENPDHRGVQTLVHDLNRVYAADRALWSRDSDPGGFAWIDANDAGNNVFSFLRWGDDGSALACVANFAAVPHEGYRIGLPVAGRWDEVLNTDAETYVGSGVGNFGGVEAGDDGWHGQPASATLRVPPLGTVWLRHTPEG